MLIRWNAGGRRFRIDPGLYEDPVGTFAELERLSILDDEAVRTVGFGVADLAEVALRAMDRALVRLEEIWRLDTEIENEQAWSITASEYEHARRRFPGSAVADHDVDRVLGSCANPEQARRALEFATARGTALSKDVGPTLPQWRGIMAVTIGNRRTFVPSSLMLEGLDGAAVRLAARLERRKQYRSRRLDLARGVLGLAARELDNDVLFPVDIGTERPVVVVRPDERHLVAIDVVAGASENRLTDEMRAAAVSLRSIDRRTIWTSPIGGLSVPDDAEVVRLIVVDAGHRPIIDTAFQPVTVALAELVHVIGRVEDSVELWEFLAEVVGPPRIERMLAPGLPELWDLWRGTGTLNPDFVRADEALVGGSTGLDLWAESARWEMFDSVLAEAGRHSSRHVCRRRVVDDHEAHLWRREPRHLTIIRTDPSLILEVPLDDLGPLDVQIVAEFASVLSTAAEQLEPFRRAVERCRSPLQILIEANAVRPAASELDRDDPWIGADSSQSPIPIAVIRFDFHLFALFASSADRARHLVAMALDQVLRGIGTPKSLAAECADAWRDWEGAFRAVAGESAPTRPFVAPRTVRPYDTARVRRQLSDRLRSQGLGLGSYRDDAAIQFCDRHITANLYSILVDEIATYARMELLVRGASETGAAVGDHRRRSLHVRAGLGAPWGDSLRIDESVGSRALANWVRAVQLVLELSLRSVGAGRRTVGRTDWGRLLAVADSLLDISQMRAQARFFGAPFKIDIDDGRVSMRLGPSAEYELAAFDVFRRLFQLRPDELDGIAPSDGLINDGRPTEEGLVYENLVQSMDGDRDHADSPFESLIGQPDVPGELRAVDSAMRDYIGTGFDGILATLRSAGSWRRDPGLEHAVVNLTYFIRDVCEWSAVPTSEVRAAIGLLTLRAGDLRSEAEADTYPYWHVERRRFRSATRPFLVVDDGEIWIIPELAIAAQRVLARYLSDGRLPWPDLPEPLRRAFRRYREVQNHELAQLAAERLNSAGFLARRGLRPAKLRKAGVPLPDSVGEIDVLVADNSRRRLWVIEAKDPEEPFTPHELWSGAEEFRRHHVAQLQRKTEGVAAARDELVGFLGARRGVWAVNPLFLTSRVELAAFDSCLDAPFVVLEDVAELLGEQEPPERGLFVPKWAQTVLGRPSE